MPDTAIDTIDIPETTAAQWATARRGVQFRPVKQPVTIRLDSDIIDWFKRKAAGRGYQSEINRALRLHVQGMGKPRR